MTATARVVLTDALKLLRVIAAEEEPEAVDLVDGLRWLNRKLHNLKTKNADIDYQNITLDDAVPVPDELEDAVLYMISAAMAPLWGTQLTPEVAVEAKDAVVTLQAYYGRVGKLKVDDGIHARDSRYGYNINSDT